MTQPSSQPADLSPRRRSPRLPRWLGVVFPLAVLTALGMAYTAAVNRTLHPTAVQAGGATAIGLAAGALTRRSASGRSLILQWWIALAAATVGLLLAGLITGGSSGVAAPLGNSVEARLADLAWLALAGVGAFLALRARRPRPIRPPRPTLRQRADALVVDLRLRWQRLSPATWWRRHRLGIMQTRPRTSTQTAASPARRRVLAGRSGNRVKAKPAKPSRARTARPAVRAARRAARRGIRFTGTEEARCPYCLEPVQPNDPRGSMVCPVCHTRHHADCWAVTGVCQMPHLYVEAPVGRQGANR